MTISIIAAMAENGLIGNGNALPWHLPADMAHFKELTLGKPVLMGENTFLSIGRALKDRKNIVLSNKSDFSAENCLIAGSIEEAIDLADREGAEELMVIGGASVYRQFLPIANKMYLTIIEGDFNGDIFFPEYNRGEWEVVEAKKHGKDINNPYSLSFQVLLRKK
jgi:dihydrofolate reductase